MSETEDKKAIVLGGGPDPDAAADYKTRIAKAQSGAGVNALKGSTPLGHIERPSIPILTKPQGQSTQSAGLVDGGVQPRPAGSPVLSPATEQQLQDAARASAQQAPAAPAAAEGAPEKKDADDDIFAMFDFAGKNEAERLLNNKKRREFIESRCAPMDFQELLFKDEVSQKVPIKPGAFELTVRTLRPVESLFVKQFMANDTQIESYFTEKYTLCQLAMAVVAINDSPFGAPHLSQDGSSVEKDIFLQRLKKITKMSAYVVGDIALNYAWFDIRVRKLFLADELGNT